LRDGLGTLVLTGAAVLSPHTEAVAGDTVAIAEGRIRAVGTRAEVLARLVGAAPSVVELSGGCLVPGFVDPHNHLLATGEAMVGVDAGFPSVRSMTDLVAAVGEATLAQPPGSWVRGHGMDFAKYPQQRLPCAADLDAVSSDHPVIVFHKSGHSAVVNSVALRLAGDAVRRDPDGGYFARDAAGEPTGYCVDAALDHVFPRAVDIGCHGPNFHFDASPQELRHALEVGMDAYLAAGITTVCDPQVTRRELSTYLGARREDALRLRVVAMPLSNNLAALRDAGMTGPFGDERLRIGAMKFYCDGALTSGTALFRDGYAEGSLTKGLLFWQPEQLRDLVGEAMLEGWQVGIHAQGDLGIEYALRAIEHGVARTGSQHRHRIEHCGYPTAAQQDRIAALGIVPVNQPNFLVESGDDLCRTLGDRVHGLQPLRSELDRQILTVLSSDSFVSNFRPLATLSSAMARTTPDGLVVGPDQRITFHEALRAHTLSPAGVLSMDHLIGSVEPGKLADLLYFDTDLRTVPAPKLPRLAPAATLVDGAVVAGTLPPPAVPSRAEGR
jgi:predicted amidohydrolase YtcJ